jgi:HK97 family phage major capsid protein/HK97 family phage prohead protease
METRKTMQTKTLHRMARLDRAKGDAESRTFELSFSSEEPYQRYMWDFDGVVDEILDHGPASARLGRLQDAGPLLLDHDPTRHVGVIENAEIAADRKGRAMIRFGRSPDAEAAMRDVMDGIRTHVSVGYVVHRARVVGREEGRQIVRVEDWEPYEISLVAIPADPTVGVGRSTDQTVTTELIEDTPEPPAPVQSAPEPVIESRGVTPMSDPNLQPADPLKRAAAIASIGAAYAAYVTSRDVSEALTANRSVEEFQDLVMKRMTEKTQAVESPVGLSKGERKRFNLARAVLAAVTGDWKDAGFEREVSQAAQTKFSQGVDRGGFVVPFEVLYRDFNVGAAAEAGNLVATDLRDDLYTDVLRNALVLGRLGTLMLPGLTSNIDIPRKISATTPAFVTEIAAATEGQPNTAKVTLSPKRITTFVEPSLQAMRQSSLGVEQMIRQDLLDGVNVLIENGAINGAGTGANPRGIRNVAGIGSVIGGVNGAQINWGHIVGLESAVANANAEPDQVSGYLVNTRTRGWLKTQQKAANLPFVWDGGAQPLNGYRAGVSNNVPNTLTKGTATSICSSLIFANDWRMLVIGMFGGVEITIDPYTLATTGQVRLTVNAFVDVGCRQPASFAVMDDALTA